MFQKKIDLIALALLLLLGAIWGSGYSLARFAVTNGVNPLGYAYWQSLGPAILLGLWCYRPGHSLLLNKRSLLFYFLCGFLGIALPNTNMHFTAAKLPAGLLGVIVNTVPIFIYVMAFALRQEKFCWQRAFGVLCAVTGIMFIVLPSTSLPTAEMVPWVLRTLITPWAFALCAIYIAARRPQGTDALALSAGMLIASSLLLTPMVFGLDDFYVPHWPLTKPDIAVFVEVLLSSIGYVLFFKLLKRAGAVYYSLVGGVVSLTSLFWGWLFFGEVLNVWTGVAVIFILMAIVIVSLKSLDKERV